MAGDWIKMRVDLATSPKVVRISSALRADRLRVVGALHAVWCLFDVHSIDGKLDGYTLDALDELIGFAGFGAAMAAVGWIEDDGQSIAVPRFDEHNGQSAKRRAMEADRKSAVRKASAPDADKMRTREEKRREESKPKSKAESATATRLPADWSMSEEDAQFCVDTRPDLSALETAAHFRDYWHAQPGAKGRKLDWHATWRNWVRNEKTRTAPYKTRADERAQVGNILTGRAGNERNHASERDITGESYRVA